MSEPVQAIPRSRRPVREARWWLRLSLLVLLAPGAAAHGAPWPQVGEVMPEWSVEHWRNGAPAKLADLRGDVVLVRWWTAPYCPYCAASAPALNHWHSRFADDGLHVFGFYHHKVDEPLRPADVDAFAERLDFAFPYAIDTDWRTLRRWWLEVRPRKQWTSVTFLIGRDGRVVHIHPGGQYVKGDDAYLALESAIRSALQGEPQATDDGT